MKPDHKGLFIPTPTALLEELRVLKAEHGWTWTQVLEHLYAAWVDNLLNRDK